MTTAATPGHASHVPSYPRTKCCYDVRIKGAIVEGTTLLDWNDAPFSRTMADPWSWRATILKPKSVVEIERQASLANETSRLPTLLR